MTTPAEPWRRRGATWLLLAAVGAVLAASCAGWFGRWAWWADAMSGFRVHFVLSLLILGAGGLALRRWRVGGLAVAGAALNFLPVAWLYVPPEAPGPVSAEIRLLHLNADSGQADLRGVAAWIRDADADLVLLQEVEDHWGRHLAAALDDYTLATTPSPQQNLGYLMLVRRDPARPVEVLKLRIHATHSLPDHFWLLETVVRVAGNDVAFSAVRTSPPIDAASAADRNTELAYAGAWSREQTLPHAVVGDLNATPWSPTFHDLLASTGLRNSQEGFGVQSTWPTGQGSLVRFPIDHVLHSEELVTLDRRVGPDVGSDHLPLEVTLGVLAP